jgi:antitoxin HicB
MHYKIPLILTPQAEDGFCVTSPLLPELHTEGETVADAMANAQDALSAVIEIYEDLGHDLPGDVAVREDETVLLDALVAAS